MNSLNILENVLLWCPTIPYMNSYRHLDRKSFQVGMQKFTWKEMSPIYIHVWIQLENVSISCYIDFLFFVCSNRNWHWFGHLFRRHFEQRCEQLWIPCHSQHARDNLLLVQERRSSSAVSTILLFDTFCPPWLDWLAYKSVESNRMFFSSISWEKLISFFWHFDPGYA
jgi:hypothetical protein